MASSLGLQASEPTLSSSSSSSVSPSSSSLTPSSSPSPSSSSTAAAASWRPLNRPAELERVRGSAALEGHLLYASLRSAAGALEQYDLLLAPDGRSLRCLAVLGARACGHPSIVHGGALAALLDDAFGTLVLHCGVGSGFTANLSVDYTKPVPAGARLEISVRVVRTEPSKSGRSDKVFLEAAVRGAPGGAHAETVFARSTALFIAKRTLLPDVARAVTGGLWRMLA